MAPSMKIRQVDKDNPALREMIDRMRREVRRRHGENLTFEQKRDAAAEVMADALWLDEDEELQDLVTKDEEIDVAEERYRRLAQPSAVVCFGRWGGHHVPEALYRRVGVHNGHTIKPLELRVGMLEHMTPDFARIVGDLAADKGSRGVQSTLKSVGLTPPSRAFLEDRVARLAAEVALGAEQLEEKARAAQPLPEGIAAVSCGMDRMAVRMAEPLSPDAVQPPLRREPYVRTPPEPKAHNYRMAWVGNTTVYDRKGKPLHTWRYAAPAHADPGGIALRVAADVERVVKARPKIKVQCIQDGAIAPHAAGQHGRG